MRDRKVVFKVDSMLVARQFGKRRPWKCRFASLLHLRRRRVLICQPPSQNGVVRDMRHIYSEFNQAADVLSNQGVDEEATNG